MKTICAILSIGFVASCNSASTKIASTDSALKAAAPETSGAAVYAGTLPCGDCEGIDVSLQLNPDSAYFMNSVYKGSRVDNNSNSFKDTGAWTMHGADTLILLQKRTAVKYIKTDSTLTQLDGSGNIITGPLADMFILHKK
ncbi:MAG TPA: copper resistance protein NlpE [Parafilimonas sp.]|nr:copper resistance protein NlpE [Parafilimonas sp.]